MKKDELLLRKNTVVDKSATLLVLNKLDISELEAYIKQKPNRKSLGIRTRLRLFNMINEEKTKRKKVKRDNKIDEDNKKRIEKNKTENEKLARKGKPLKEVTLKSKDTPTFREWLMELGEPPVIYDSILKQKTTEQLKKLMTNKGYFNAVVSDSVAVRKKSIQVFYIIDPKIPYTINKLTYKLDDELLNYYIVNDSSNSLIKKGDNYDIDILQSERDRISKNLRNSGYYFFSKDYVYYKIDSSLGIRKVNIELYVKNYLNAYKDVNGNDSIVESPHKKYYINNVYLYSDYKKKEGSNYPDTLNHEEIYILSNGKLNYKPKVLTDAVFVRKGELFDNSKADQTYKRLSELRAFKFVNVHYQVASADQLNCFVLLSPIKKQSFSIETEGTNTGGVLGINGSFIYQNRNSFKGAETFEFRVKGGLEAQKTIVKENTQDNIFSESVIPFNTIEFGPEVSMTIPRFVTPFHFYVSKNANPKTIFKSAYNFQQRPDFTRSALILSSGYNWNETRFKKHFVFPLEISLVGISKKTASFENYILNSNDPYYVYRFSNHFITNFRYMFNYTNQEIKKVKNFSYLKVSAESAGNALRGIYNLLDQYVSEMPVDSLNNYRLFGTTFSQYLRIESDYRFYQIINEQNKIVYRAAFGVGKPLHNLRELPLEKSFFAGGPNSIRAWKARTLGPGTYKDSVADRFDKIGDALIEANIEYRFNLFKLLNGAFFVDAGNIWLRKKDIRRPGGEFKFSSELLSEFAIGAGIGLRIDFSFFIIRFDAAVPVHDPSYVKGDRWTFDKQPIKDTNLNFGIGYPF